MGMLAPVLLKSQRSHSVRLSVLRLDDAIKR